MAQRVYEVISILVSDLVRKPEIQRRIGPAALQDLRERHCPVIDAVARTDHPLVGYPERQAKSWAEVIVVGRQQTARESCLVRRLPGQSARGPGLEHRGRNT